MSVCELSVFLPDTKVKKKLSFLFVCLPVGNYKTVLGKLNNSLLLKESKEVGWLGSLSPIVNAETRDRKKMKISFLFFSLTLLFS